MSLHLHLTPSELLERRRRYFRHSITLGVIGVAFCAMYAPHLTTEVNTLNLIVQLYWVWGEA